MAKRRVVLTGLGTVNPLGHDVEAFWADLLACKSGIRRIPRFDPSPFTSRIGGEVQDWETVPVRPGRSREARRMDRFAQFAVAAAIEAVADSGLDFASEDRRPLRRRSSAAASAGFRSSKTSTSGCSKRAPAGSARSPSPS